MEKTNDYSLFLTKYLISLLTRQFTPIYPICALWTARKFCFSESVAKMVVGNFFFLSLLSLNLVTETVFHRREKQLILLCCCALLLEMRGSGSAATFNNGERIQSEVNGACIEPIHLFSRGLTKVSKYLFLPSTLYRRASCKAWPEPIGHISFFGEIDSWHAPFKKSICLVNLKNVFSLKSEAAKAMNNELSGEGRRTKGEERSCFCTGGEKKIVVSISAEFRMWLNYWCLLDNYRKSIFN